MFKDSLYTLLKKEIMGPEKQCIQIHCKQLDDLMGISGVAGIQRGLITELCGFPGSGKTQICLQLCYSAILGMKKAVFIDTKGGFDIDRYKEIVSARIKDTKRSVNEFLSNLYVIETSDSEEFINIIKIHLNDLVKQDPNISVIVIDSFPHLLKTLESKVGDKLRQQRIIHELVTSLLKLAHNANVAVVLTNEFTTKFSEPDEPFFASSLGKTFHHRITQRLALSSNPKGDKHFANLEKSKYRACQIVEFKISTCGVE